MLARKKGQHNCISAVLYALNCIPHESNIPPRSKTVEQALKFVSFVPEEGKITVPHGAQAVGVWRLDEQYYYHLAFFDQEPGTSGLYERPGWNKGLVPVDRVEKIRRRYQDFLGTVYELHFLKKRLDKKQGTR